MALPLPQKVELDAAPTGIKMADLVVVEAKLAAAAVTEAKLAAGAVTATKLPAAAPGSLQAATEAHRLVGASGQPAFQNIWVNYGGTIAAAHFWKDPWGTVFLGGVVKNGIAGLIFNLPAGYRPLAQVYFIVMGSVVTDWTSVYVTAAGDVVLNSGANTVVGLDGICFRAA